VTDLQLGSAPDEFTAATWNVYHGSSRADLDPIRAELEDRGASLLLLSELSQPWAVDWLQAHGWRAWRYGRQYTIAWRAPQWRRVNTGGVRLSPTGYWSPHGDQYSAAAWAILSDCAGRTITSLAYHLPSGVQVREDRRPERRYAAARESVETMQALASRAQTRACLFGGDDNVDELHGIGSGDDTWAPWHQGPLRWVRAPRPTFGHRLIDDLAQTGLHPQGTGWTIPGTTAEKPSHRAYGRRFTWAH